MNRFLPWSVCLLFVLTACDDEPERAPAEGLYVYTAQHRIPETNGSMMLSGLLRISASSDDAIEGEWQVDQLHPELARGEWNDTVNAYVAISFPSYTGTAVHWITRGATPTDLGCTGEYTWVSDGVEGSVPLVCSLQWQGTSGVVPPEQLPRRSPVIRPVDADTVADLPGG